MNTLYIPDIPDRPGCIYASRIICQGKNVFNIHSKYGAQINSSQSLFPSCLQYIATTCYACVKG